MFVIPAMRIVQLPVCLHCGIRDIETKHGESDMTYTVHFQKGTRVGSLRMIRVEALNEANAIGIASRENRELLATGYRVVRVDTFDTFDN